MSAFREIELHPISREDVPHLAKLEQAAQAWPWSAEQILFEISEQGRAGGAFSMLAREGPDNSSVRGYYFARAVADEAEILNLVVDSGVRRRGIGRSLLEHLLQEARKRGVKTAFLEVRASNSAAIFLYKSCGFNAVGFRKGYYRNNQEDAVTMSLKLDENNRL